MPKYAILAEGAFDYILSKTGNAIIRYRPEEVACVVDSKTAGKTAAEVLGIGDDIPVVASLQDALQYDPNAVLIGTAPPGGQLPQSWREMILMAIENRLDVVAGLHSFLSDDIEFSDLASKKGVHIWDLRKPPDPLPFSKGSWQTRKTPVLLTVGSDCDTGKMTAAWELKRELESRGVKAAFVGTGQTGILLGGFGVPVDAVVSDFVAGAIEAEVDKAAQDSDIVIVEGQGSVTHMAYSGVTVGLLHGCMPEMLLMCHEPDRKLDTFGYPMTPFHLVLEIYLKLLEPFRPTELVGISLMTPLFDETTAVERVKEYEEKFQVPTTDPVRNDMSTIAENVISLIR
ncbi:MAG: hypothetical protein CMG27_03060 [Candidatus Marinimicrobia bacterium]|jgi:uncharacterized NAD-dependent epimerase/dehydratase family protein|nr:hypothetical protein [Candidatus Neomarinimicrobiota bacterium]